MNNSDIQTFLTLVNTKNITRTARTLFISQPTVSRRLKQLETELGYPLVHREKGEKQISLTPAGEEFIPLAEQLMTLWQRMRQLGNEDRKNFLSIGCTDTFNNAILMPFYESLWTEHRSDLSLQIATHYSIQLYEMLENHEIDLGLAYHYLDFKNITAEPLMEEEMFIIQPDDEHTLRRPVMHTEELDVNNEVFLSWGTEYQIWHNQWVLKDQRPGITADSYPLLRSMMGIGNSWAIAPYTVVKKLESEEKIYVSMIGNDVRPPRRVTYLLRNKNESLSISRATSRFAYQLKSFLRDQYADKENEIRIYES